MSMWRIQNRRYVAFSLSREGAITIKHLHWDELKYARATHILQMWPERIELGKLYARG